MLFLNKKQQKNDAVNNTIAQENMEDNIMGNRARNINLHFMVSEEEHVLIKSQMAEAGIKSMRAYLLKKAVDGHVIRVELDSVHEMIRLLSNATNNINQIARRINQTGNFYATDLEEIRRQYEKLWNQIKEILRRLSAIPF